MNKNNKKLVLKKAHFPLKACLLLAFKNLWHKKFRYLIMLIICSLSLAFLSFSIELNGDILRQNVYTTVGNGYQFTEIYERAEVSDEAIKENPYNKYAYQELETNQYEKIKREIPNLTVHEYKNVNINYAGINIENANYFYTGYLNTLIRYDETNKYDLICGRTPKEGTKEIMITDYLVSAFDHFNLYPTCNNIYDYLNKHLNLNLGSDYIIVGIIRTNFDKWSHFMVTEKVEANDKSNYAYDNDLRFMNSVFLPKDTFELEKAIATAVLPFTNYETDNKLNLGTWEIDLVKDGEDPKNYKGVSTIGLESRNINIINARSWYYFGRNVYSDDEIVIPYSIVRNLYGFNWTYIKSSQFYNWSVFDSYRNIYENTIEGSKIILKLTSNNGTLYEREFKVVGVTAERTNQVTADSPVFQVSSDVFRDIFGQLSTQDEKIFVELPKSQSEAYNLFKEAYQKGYVLNVWPYRADIDNYEVDPFVNLLSKAGLFIFAAFTMGIMWTIISIEIVDSRKEIGILRSIGLSGFQVSLIFIIQISIVVLLAYGLGVYAGYLLVPLYNTGIMDELNKVTLYMYTFTYRSFLYLAIFAVLMTVISTIIPLWKIMSHKIIDIISERDN